MNKLIAAAALALTSSSAYAAQNGDSALDQLSKAAGSSTKAEVPAPVAKAADSLCHHGQVPPCSGAAVESEQAHAEWQAAEKLYSDSVYQPRPQARIDAGPSYDVMFQGFHWFADNYWLRSANGWWGTLEAKAGILASSGFTMVWFPPAAVGSYYPTEWYNLHSQWGDKKHLLSTIGAMHRNNMKVIADVVLNHRNGRENWADFYNPDWPSNVVLQDDEWPGDYTKPYNGKSSNYDEAMKDDGCRDIDQTNPLVQKDIRVFLRWLRHTIGYDGWRYDFVNGYAPYHVGDYNNASGPVFSLGEYWQRDRKVITNWIDGTDNTGGKGNASSAFDYPTYFNLVNATENGDYGVLNDGGKPSGIIGWWPNKALTFVENHDTSPRDVNFIASASQAYKDQRMQMYAYVLTHPGLPCVFWPHFFDWGQDYQSRIVKLVQLRKAAGINSMSKVQVAAAERNLYAAITSGDRQNVAVKLGSSWAWNPPGEKWTLAASGTNYAVWTQPK